MGLHAPLVAAVVATVPVLDARLPILALAVLAVLILAAILALGLVEPPRRGPRKQPDWRALARPKEAGCSISIGAS